MFEIGYSEILVIAIVLIVVVGPKDLPKMLRAFGKTMTKFRQMSGDFQRQFNDALKEAELDEVRKTISDVRKLDPRQQVRDALNPLRDAGNALKADLNKVVQAPVAPAVAVAPAIVDKPVEVTMGGAKPAPEEPAAKKKPPAKKATSKVSKAKAVSKTAAPAMVKTAKAGAPNKVAERAAEPATKAVTKTVAKTPGKVAAVAAKSPAAKSPAAKSSAGKPKQTKGKTDK